ncbi:MAG: hypothetical protein GY810_22195 [Aureispira sp.]|nr:hypothetical protein [Aureispira sp.]
MYNTKLGRLFRSLDKKELKQFKLWVVSPAHNKHQDVLKFFEYLWSRRYVSVLTFRKSRVFKHLYPDRTYDDLRMRHIMSLGLESLLNFVRYNLQVKESILPNVSLAKDLHARKLDKLAQQYLKKATNDLQEQPYRSGNYYLESFHLEAEEMEQIGTQHRIGTNNLQQISNSLSHFFMVNTLRYACVHLSHQNLRKSDCKIVLLGAVLDEIEKGDYSDNPAVMVYYYTYKALEEPETESYFGDLKRYLLNNANCFSLKEYKNLFLQALNYCIKRLNIGGETYIREAFELYRDGLDKEVLFDGEILSSFAYKNIVALGLRLGEFDWVTQFIPEYANYLDGENRDSYVHYNTARLHFAQGDYKTSLSLLAQTEYDDVFMNMDAKVMQLKIYYEEKEYEVLDSLLQSFTVFLQRKNIIGYHKEHYKNVIFFIKKLLLLHRNDQEAKTLLKQQIEETKPLGEKPWLLKQLKSV